MLKGNKCELCYKKIQGIRAQHKQTKYCQQCAKQKKKENTENSWLPEEKRAYMRLYMRSYRQTHPKLSSPYVLKHRQKKREALAAGSCMENSSSVTKTANQNTNYSSCLWFLPFLLIILQSPEAMSKWFDSLEMVVKYLELAVVKITGLIIIVLICWQHIKHLLGKANKNKESKENKDELT